MPALVDIRRQIKSVKNTQQITRAMKMVSAAKLRRAQDAIFAARPYARKMLEVLKSLASRAEPGSHPLLERRGGGRVVLVVVTADKGLCGGFNANITRAALRFLEERKSATVSLELLGRKGRDFFKRRGVPIRGEHVGVFQSTVKYEVARNLAASIIASYTKEEIDEVYLAYNEFKNVIQQQVVVEPLLPVEQKTVDPKDAGQDYLYEPTPREIFAEILPKHVEIQIWRALLESQAAEHGARMAAMDAATNNAGERIDDLTLYMNKVRQAAITKEIIEVVSGAGRPE
jgi:F-type H+-transporting ATPase subunit gamma